MYLNFKKCIKNKIIITGSFRWKVEHWSKAPNNLCGFQVNESALWTPSNLKALYFSLIKSPPPQAACKRKKTLISGDNKFFKKKPRSRGKTKYDQISYIFLLYLKKWGYNSSSSYFRACSSKLANKRWSKFFHKCDNILGSQLSNSTYAYLALWPKMAAYWIQFCSLWNESFSIPSNPEKKPKRGNKSVGYICIPSKYEILQILLADHQSTFFVDKRR